MPDVEIAVVDASVTSILVPATPEIVISVTGGGGGLSAAAQYVGFLGVNTNPSPLGGFRILTVDLSGNLIYGDSTDVNQIGRPFGFTTGAISQGITSLIVTEGYIDDPGFSMIPGTEYYLSTNGQYTQHNLLSGSTAFDLSIGKAVTPTRIHINISAMPIVR